MALSKIDTTNMIEDVPQSKLDNNINFRNIIINGGMDIAQRSTSVASITTGAYHTIDRFRTQINTLGTFTQSQSTDVPSGQGFSKSLKMDCTTADASPSAGDYLLIDQAIEAQNLQYLSFGNSSAKSLTLSFWVKSNKTGTYIVWFFQPDGSRTISKSYTINSASTWEKKSITIDGDTSGTINNDNGEGLRVAFYLGAGSDTTSGTLATSWESDTQANRAVGQVNLADSTSNEWYITGVQLEAGTTASDFEFLPFDVNYQRCARYYATNPRISGIWYNASDMRVLYDFHTPMRANPSLILINSSNYHEHWNIAGYTGFSGVSLVDATKFGIDFQIGSSSNRGRSYGDPAMVNHSTVATDAEL